MSQILIGRAGEELHSFDLDDIKRGAVRESGLLPELFETKLPPMISGALASGAERKCQEHEFALQDFDFPVYLPPSILPRALEDSKEEQTTQVGITKGKLERGFLFPVFSYASTLTDMGREHFLKGMAQRAHTDDIKNLIVFADDRQLRMDPVFLDPLYGRLRYHPNDQVREIFKEGHLTPGKRVKEVDGATLGIVNSVYRFHQVMKLLTNQEITFDKNQYMDTTLCFVPMMPEGVPLPENGLIVKAIGNPRVLGEVTEHHIHQIAKGRILTYDHFDKPVGEGFPDWVNLHALKRAVANDQSRVEKAAYRGVDKEHATEYLTERHSPAAAMTAFAHALGIPKKTSKKISVRPEFERREEPKTILTTGNFLSGTLTYEDLQEAFPINSGKRVSRDMQPLTLRGLEVMAHNAQAFATVNSNKYPVHEEDIKKYGSQENLELIRELETSLVAAYLITMSTQAGASQHIGRPNLVDKSWYKRFGLYHPDLCNLGLTGDTEKEAYYLYESVKDMKNGLDSFDKTTYQHDVRTPKSEFLDEKELKNMFGIKNTDYVVDVYGSSTGFAAETYNHPKQLTEELSKLCNVVTADGGGVRSAMRGMKDGVFQAHGDGYNVLNIGFRSETDVSPLEGNIEDFFNEAGSPLKVDPKNNKHFTTEDGQLHVYKFQRIIARQAAIAEIANATVVCDGGKGTVLEFFITALHNARVNITGEGFLGHSRLIANVVLNRDIETYEIERGVLDVLLEPWREHADMIGLKEFTGKNPVPEAVQFLKDHAEGREMLYGQKEPHNFDLCKQKLYDSLNRKSTGRDYCLG